MSDDGHRTFWGQQPEMPWKRLRELAYRIHQSRLGTEDTRDDCTSCWNMARERLGMEPVAEKDVRKDWVETPSGLLVPNQEDTEMPVTDLDFDDDEEELADELEPIAWEELKEKELDGIYADDEEEFPRSI